MTVDANFQAITATFLDIDKAIAEEKFDAALEMIAQLKDQAHTNVFINPEELTTKETAIQVVKCEKQFNTMMDQLRREQKAGDIGNSAKIQHLESDLQELIGKLENWGVNTKDQRKQLVRAISGKGTKNPRKKAVLSNSVPKPLLGESFPKEIHVDTDHPPVIQTKNVPDPVKLLPPIPSPNIAPETRPKAEMFDDDDADLAAIDLFDEEEDVPLFQQPPAPPAALSPPSMTEPKAVPQPESQTPEQIVAEFTAHLTAEPPPITPIDPIISSPIIPPPLTQDILPEPEIAAPTEYDDHTQELVTGPQPISPYGSEWDLAYYNEQLETVKALVIERGYHVFRLPESWALPFELAAVRRESSPDFATDALVQIMLIQILPLHGILSVDAQGINYVPIDSQNEPYNDVIRKQLLGKAMVTVKKLRTAFTALTNLTDHKAIIHLHDLLVHIFSTIQIKPASNCWQIWDGTTQLHFEVVGACVTSATIQMQHIPELPFQGVFRIPLYYFDATRLSQWFELAIQRMQVLLGHNHNQLQASEKNIRFILSQPDAKHLGIWVIGGMGAFALVDLIPSMIVLILFGVIGTGCYIIWGIKIFRLLRAHFHRKDPELTWSPLSNKCPEVDPRIQAMWTFESPDFKLPKHSTIRHSITVHKELFATHPPNSPIAVLTDKTMAVSAQFSKERSISSFLDDE